jgi:cell division septation protein DedD
MPVATAGGASPQPAATPPAPQKVASVQPVPVASSAPSAADSAPTGGFAVQLAVSASEGEARSTFQKLQQKYADLGSQSSIIRKAEVNGNTVFRVRVGPMSRDDASSLCSKLQGQGGQCFVAKN